MSTSRKIVFNMPSLLPEAVAAPGRRPTAESRPESEAARDGADVRKLAMLVEVSQALTGTLNLQAGLYGVLEVLERRCGAVRGAVTLLEEESGMLAVEAALGYPRPAGRVRYRLGEGVTGVVAQTGTPAVVPRVSREPRFLHRAAGRAQRGGEITFICVPITLDGATAGTLGIEQAFVAERDRERTVKALRITAGMIAQALRIQRLIDARAPQAGGGEHPAPPGAAGALRVHPHARQQRADAPGIRAGGAGRGDRGHGPDPRASRGPARS